VLAHFAGDELFFRVPREAGARLRAGGFRVVVAPDVRVRTSSRTQGRAIGGLADLLRGLGV
jgi:hypothetical protein